MWERVLVLELELGRDLMPLLVLGQMLVLVLVLMLEVVVQSGWR
jgi:hypothetical protein